MVLCMRCLKAGQRGRVDNPIDANLPCLDELIALVGCYRRAPRLVIAVFVLRRRMSTQTTSTKGRGDLQVLDIHLQQVPLGFEFCVLSRGRVDLSEELGERLLELDHIAVSGARQVVAREMKCEEKG